MMVIIYYCGQPYSQPKTTSRNQLMKLNTQCLYLSLQQFYNPLANPTVVHNNLRICDRYNAGHCLPCTVNQVQHFNRWAYTDIRDCCNRLGCECLYCYGTARHVSAHPRLFFSKFPPVMLNPIQSYLPAARNCSGEHDSVPASNICSFNSPEY